MKIFALTLITLSFFSVSFAQLRSSHHNTMDGLKDARKQMEAATESTILEKLEEARLQDERNRREKFETLNFNVVNEPTAPASAPATF